MKTVFSSGIFFLTVLCMPVHMAFAEHWAKTVRAAPTLFNGEQLDSSDVTPKHRRLFTLRDPELAPTSPWLSAESTRYRRIVRSLKGDVLLLPPQMHLLGMPQSFRAMWATGFEDLALANGVDLVANQELLLLAFANNRDINMSDASKVADDAGATQIVVPFVGYVALENESMLAAVAIRTHQKNSDGTWNNTPRESFVVKLPFNDSTSKKSVITQALTKLAPWLGWKKEVDYQRENQPEQTEFPSIEASPEQLNKLPALQQARFLQLLGSITPKLMSAERQGYFRRSLEILDSRVGEHTHTASLYARAYRELDMHKLAHIQVNAEQSETAGCYREYLRSNITNLRNCHQQIEDVTDRVLLSIDSVELASRFGLDTEADEQLVYGYLQNHTAWHPFVASYLDNFDQWNQPDFTWLKKFMDARYPIEGIQLQSLLLTALIDPESARKQLRLAAVKHYIEVVNTNGVDLFAHPKGIRDIDILLLLRAHAINNLYVIGHRIAALQGSDENSIAFAEHTATMLDGHPISALLHAKAHKTNSTHATKSTREYHSRQAEEHSIRAIYWSGENSRVAKKAHSTLNDIPQRTMQRPNFWYGDLSYNDATFFNRKKKEAYRENVKSPLVLYSIYHFQDLVGQKLRNDEPLGELEDWFVGHPEREDIFLKHHKRVNAPDEAIAAAERAIATSPEVFSNYKALAEIFRAQGDLEQVAQTYLRYPHFQKVKNSDRVLISNQSALVGIELMWSGRADLAKQFYEISQWYHSGSADNLVARMRLHQLNGDFHGMVYEARHRVERYGDPSAIRHFLATLVLLGGAEEALTIFDAIIADQTDMRVWTAALVAQRAAGWNQTQIDEWLLRDHLANINRPAEARAIHYLRSIITDRTATDLNMAVIQQLTSPSVITDEGGYLPIDWLRREPGFPSSLKPGTRFQVDKSKYRVEWGEIQRSPIEMHVVVDNMIKRQQYNEALAVFAEIREPEIRIVPPFPLVSSQVNHYTLAHIHSGQSDRVRTLINTNKPSEWKPEQHLAAALLEGFAGDTPKAARHLRIAMAVGKGSAKSQAYIPYTVAQTIDILWKETGLETYRELALAWSKNSQIVEFYHAWPYALAAITTQDAGEQLEFASKAMFLDADSLWLQELPAETLSKARSILQTRNPFVPAENDPEKSAPL